MKTVVNSGQVAHLWYHATQAHARNSNRSFYFDGDTIFSYGSHFPIARHVWTNKKHTGERAVLFTTRDYSVTTSCHKSAVRSAIPSSAAVFFVPNVNAETREDHAANLAEYVQRIADTLDESSRARSSWAYRERNEHALALSNDVRAYAKFFRVQCPVLPVIPALDSERVKTLEAKESARAGAREERERVQREHEAKRQAGLAGKWRTGEYNGSLYSLPIMLRIRDFGCDASARSQVAVVETSKGAQVPISHALRGLRFVRQVVAGGQEYVRNGHTFHLGHYAIDRIETDGTLHAGCHVISLAEIERIAPELETLANGHDVTGNEVSA